MREVVSLLPLLLVNGRTIFTFAPNFCTQRSQALSQIRTTIQSERIQTYKQAVPNFNVSPCIFQSNNW